MAATILEDDSQIEPLNPEELATAISAETAEQTPESQDLSAQEAPTEAPVTEEEIPDKYKGKTIKEVVAMHQEAEKLLGRQSNEVGELRSVVDTFIQGQTQKPEPTPPPQEPVDFLEDPEGAVSQAIENHPTVKAAQEAAQKLEQQTAVQQLREKHPDMQEVLASPEFVEFVKSSPIRRELFYRADQQYDFGAADELVTLFKERRAIQQTAQATEEAAREDQVTAASTGDARGAADAATSKKRIYRRADIIKLMKTDPARYEALSGEILEAYKDGRVR